MPGGWLLGPIRKPVPGSSFRIPQLAIASIPQQVTGTANQSVAVSVAQSRPLTPANCDILSGYVPTLVTAFGISDLV